MVALCKELERQEQLSKENETEIRRTISNEFLEKINEMNRNWRRRCDEQISQLRDSYEKQLENLENFYRRKLKRTSYVIELDSSTEDSSDSKTEDSSTLPGHSKRARYDVINLDSSTEDISEDSKKELESKTSEKINEMQDRKAVLQSDNSRLSLELRNAELQKEVVALRAEVSTLRSLLADAESKCDNFAAREEQSEKVTTDLIKLRDTVSDLEALVWSHVAEREELEEDSPED